jgi:hypothetical protein
MPDYLIAIAAIFVLAGFVKGTFRRWFFIGLYLCGAPIVRNWMWDSGGC